MTVPVHYKLRDTVEGPYSYVLIDKVLKKKTCSHEDIQEQILIKRQTANVKQTTLFFEDHPSALQLHFYED